LTPFINWLHGLPGSETLKFTIERGAGLEVYLPWQMIIYLAGGFLAGIVVSLLTKPLPKEKLDNFYALLRTPVAVGEKVLAPCTLPVGAVVPPKRAVFPNTNWEFLIPSRTSVVGVAAGAAIVCLMVYAVYLLVR
jgi:hypothetical protein